MILLHIIPAHEWQAAQSGEVYRPAAFAQDGFIHCSRIDQVERTAGLHFPGRRDLLLLCIDPRRVRAPVWYENLDGGESLFPHIYGPLNLDAVLAAPVFQPDEEGFFHLPDEVTAWQAQLQPATPQQAADVLREMSAGVLADIATGGGNFLETLTETFKEIRLAIGIDNQLAHGRNPLGLFVQGKASFAQMDAQQLGLADACLDTGTMANSLHHLPQPLHALAELKRAIRPGGRCVLQEMYCDGQNLAQKSHVMLHHWWADVDRERGIFHTTTFSRAGLIELVEQCGWRRVMFLDIADFSGDPREPELLNELDQIIDRYQGFAASQPNGEVLRAQGEALRTRVHEFGFQNATALLVIAEK